MSGTASFTSIRFSRPREERPAVAPPLRQFCDDLQSDLCLLRAAKLAAWTMADHGADKDTTAVFLLPDSLQKRLELRTAEADAIREADRALAGSA